MNRRVWCFVLVYSRDAVCRALSLVRIVPQGHWYVPPRITGLNAPLLWGGGSLPALGEDAGTYEWRHLLQDFLLGKNQEEGCCWGPGRHRDLVMGICQW